MHAGAGSRRGNGDLGSQALEMPQAYFQEALILWESLHELGRREATQRLSLDYRRRHALSEERAKAFLDETAKPEPWSAEQLDGLARGIAESCTGCHHEHRD